MAFIFMLIGAVIGGSIEGDDGAVAGAVIGFLAGHGLSQFFRLRRFEKRLDEVDAELAYLRAEVAPVELDLEFPDDPVPESAPATAPAQPAEPASGPAPVPGAAPAAAVAAAPPSAAVPPPVVARNAPDLGHPEQRDPAEIAAPQAVAGAQASTHAGPAGPDAADADPWMGEPAFAEPAEPGLIDRVLDRVRRANPVVLIGVIVLFFGIAFGLKLAVDGGLVPVELRVAGVALFGMALWGVGWRMRASSPGFALPVQGAGAGALFLTVFAAYAFYGLLPAGLAMSLLFAMVVLTALMAIAQSSQALAALGVTGGFLAPVLVSTGSGDHVALFGYYLVLNVLVLTVAWFNAWRILNLLGFFFTFGVGTAWGYEYYRPELFASTEPFLVAFALLYVAVAVLFALRQPPKLVGLVDGTLVFGTPLVGFALQTQLLEDNADALAISAVSASVFYMVVAVACIRSRMTGLRTLGEAFVANSIIFATLAVPLALDARWTAATWALEGAGIVWIAVRQNRLLPRLMGSALQFLAGAALLIDLSWSHTPDAFFNSEYLGAVLVAFGGLFCGIWQTRHADRLYSVEVVGAVVLTIWGLLWWFGAGAFESMLRGSDDTRFGLLLAYTGISAVVLHWLADRTGVATPAAPAHLLLPTYGLTLFAMVFWHDTPLDGGGLFGWPIALAAHVLTLRRLEGETHPWQSMLHGLGIVLLAALGTWVIVHELSLVYPDTTLWYRVVPGVVAAGLVLLTTAATTRVSWPFVEWRGGYLAWGGAPLVALLVLWLLAINFDDPGSNWPIAYVPLLNPIDITAGFAILAGVTWWRASSEHMGDRWPLADTPGVGRALVAAALFFQANMVLARTVHFWHDVPWYPDALFDSETLQSAYAVFWGVTGLVGMGMGNRRHSRALWFAAAALMGVVVLKLFAVDLANTGTMARVVSFVSVGVALMAVGYFAPLPPRPESEPAPGPQATPRPDAGDGTA